MTVNLSCGQCKSIRSFSGTPPTCDVCGWVYTAQSTRPDFTPKAKMPGKSGEGVGCTLALIFLGVIVYAGYDYFFTPDKEKLATKYSVPIERVYAQPKPHGCAYNDAPLGDKHCHYEKHIIVYAKGGQVIEKDGGHVTECPSCAVWSVEQSWEKIDE